MANRIYPDDFPTLIDALDAQSATPIQAGDVVLYKGQCLHEGRIALLGASGANSGTSANKNLRNFPANVTIKPYDENSWLVWDADGQGNCIRTQDTDGLLVIGVEFTGSTSTCISQDQPSDNPIFKNCYVHDCGTNNATPGASNSGNSAIGAFGNAAKTVGNIVVNPEEHDIYVGSDGGITQDNACFNTTGNAGIRAYGLGSSIEGNYIYSAVLAAIAYSEQTSLDHGRDIVVQHNVCLHSALRDSINFDDNVPNGTAFVVTDGVVLFNFLQQNRPVLTGTTFAFTNTNPDTITDSGSGFVAAGLVSREQLMVSGAANGGNNGTLLTIETGGVAAGTLTLIATNSLVAESAGANVTISTYHFHIHADDDVSGSYLHDFDIPTTALIDHVNDQSGTAPTTIYRD